MYNVLKIIRNSYNAKPTVVTRQKRASVRFCYTITIATLIESSHYINKAEIKRNKTHKRTAGKVHGYILKISVTYYRYKKEKK